MKCGYDSILGDLYRKFSNQQKPIWEASTALYPRYKLFKQYYIEIKEVLFFSSIYFPPFRSSEENAAYISSVVNETIRCADGKIPVYPFHWNCK